MEILRPFLDVPTRLELPLYNGTVIAGFPSPADDYVECGLDLNEFMVRHPSATFFVRVAGDSMVDAGILEGDYLVVDRAVEHRNGSIVIAVVEGEFTVKRLYYPIHRLHVYELRAENPAYPSILLKPGQEFTIWGVVTGVFRKV